VLRVQLNDYVLCKITNKKFEFEVDEEQDHAGLPQATEEEPGAASQVQQQEALIEGDRDTAAAAAALQQAGPGDFALCANANTLDDYGLPWAEFAEPLNSWSTCYLNNTVTPSFSELDYYIKTEDFAGESQPAEQQQVTSVGGAGRPQQQATAEATNNAETATEAGGTAPVLPNTLPMPGDYDWETGDLPDWDDL
jgi:hypothetical protein